MELHLQGSVRDAPPTLQEDAYLIEHRIEIHYPIPHTATWPKRSTALLLGMRALLHNPALLHVVLETHSFLLLEWVCHAIIGTPCLQGRSIDITAILRHARQMAGDGVNAE